MKRSARVATIFIFLFFLLFNGVQGYLIFQRIGGAKAKFNLACTEALLSTIFQYNKLKGTDSVPRPRNALITWSLVDMTINRIDSQNVAVKSPTSRLFAMRVDPVVIEPMIGRPRPVLLNLSLLDSLYGRALDSMQIHSKFRLDTFPLIITPGNNRKDLPQQISTSWAKRRTKTYAYSTNPQRIFFYPNAMVFAEMNFDYRFLRKELFWPMLAFVFIILISNIALVFVYRTIRKQKKMNELKTDFINNMTHEMKTPITIASAGMEALEHHVDPNERTGFYLRTSKKQLHLLNEFVDRILDAAVRDISDVTLRKEKIDLHALFNDLISSHSLIKIKPVGFQLTGQTHVLALGDRLHLETAFHNIIDNAIKYSGTSVDIHIDISEDNRDSIIRIRDNGMGIPAPYVKNIFEKFFRVPQGDAQPVKGFGLGLYYVNSIIRKHGGHITVQSKPQSGTEFIITLPKYV